MIAANIKNTTKAGGPFTTHGGTDTVDSPAGRYGLAYHRKIIASCPIKTGTMIWNAAVASDRGIGRSCVSLNKRMYPPKHPVINRKYIPSQLRTSLLRIEHLRTLPIHL